MGVLIFDDRDASIVYSGSWGQAGVEEEFNGTTTFTTAVGSTATLNFLGMYIYSKSAPAPQSKPFEQALESPSLVPLQAVHARRRPSLNMCSMMGTPSSFKDPQDGVLSVIKPSSSRRHSLQASTRSPSPTWPEAHSSSTS
jgi:hypothetical protein